MATTTAEGARRPTYASVAAWAIILIAVGVTAIDLFVRGTAVEPDSVSYLSMAEGLRQLAATHWSGAPTGLWPYAYPAIMAVAGGRARTMIEWGPVVQVALLVCAAIYLVLIARRLAARRLSGAYSIAAAALLASPAVSSPRNGCYQSCCSRSWRWPSRTTS